MNTTASWIFEIENRLQDIALAVDTYDIDLLLSCCCKNACFDLGDRFQGSAKELMIFLQASRPSTLMMSHVITDVVVRIESKFEAVSTSTVAAKIVRNVGQSIQHRSVTGRYEDEWSRNQTRWLLRARRYFQVDQHFEYPGLS